MKTKSDELEELTANSVLLDTTLAQYGPEANTARHLLRLALRTVAYRIWRENRAAMARERRSRRAARLCHSTMKSSNFRQRMNA